MRRRKFGSIGGGFGNERRHDEARARRTFEEVVAAEDAALRERQRADDRFEVGPLLIHRDLSIHKSSSSNAREQSSAGLVGLSASSSFKLSTVTIIASANPFRNARPLAMAAPGWQRST